MVYEIVWTFNQMDLLDFRFHELNNIVDKWIIVEYPFGYDRKPRPLYFNENKERFKEFENKIIYFVDDHDYMDYAYDSGNSGLGLLWNRKKSKKLKEILSIIKPDDFLIVSDEDAILTKTAFTNFDPTKIYSFHMLYCLYYFNTYTNDAIFNWTQSAPFKYYNESLVVTCPIVPTNNPVNIVTKNTYGKEVGFHFAKCGGIDKIIENIKGYPHQEFAVDLNYTNIEQLTERMNNGYGWTDKTKGTDGKNWKWLFKDYRSEDYPNYINNNKQIFNKYFKGGMN